LPLRFAKITGEPQQSGESEDKNETKK